MIRAVSKQRNQRRIQVRRRYVVGSAALAAVSLSVAGAVAHAGAQDVIRDDRRSDLVTETGNDGTFGQDGIKTGSSITTEIVEPDSSCLPDQPEMALCITVVDPTP